MENKKETIWYQLQGSRNNKIVFWLLNICLILGFLGLFISKTDEAKTNASIVIGVAVLIHVVSLAAVYFDKIKRSRR